MMNSENSISQHQQQQKQGRVTDEERKRRNSACRDEEISESLQDAHSSDRGSESSDQSNDSIPENQNSNNFESFDLLESAQFDKEDRLWDQEVNSIIREKDALFRAASWRLAKEDVWETMCNVYDIIGTMMISVLWSYIAPLTARPSSGCPGRHCWGYCRAIAIYIGIATLTFPFLSVICIQHCTHRVRELSDSASLVHRSFAQRAQSLFLAALGTTWSVANSTFVFNVLAQYAYSLKRGDTSSSSDNSSSSSMMDDDEHNGPLVPSEPEHARFSVTGLALLIAVGYTSAALLSIAGISSICRLGVHNRLFNFLSRSFYLIELGLLLQNNWYYVVGYSWELLLTYTFFAFLSPTNSGAVRATIVLIFVILRAIVITYIGSSLVLHYLPFTPEDRTPDASDIHARLRLLTFRAHAVFIVVSLIDIPTYFVTVFLASKGIAALSSEGQLILLYLFAALAAVGLTWVNVKLAKIEPPTKRTVFVQEIASWLVCFLTWTPWQKTTAFMVQSLEDTIPGKKSEDAIVIVMVQICIGIAFTTAIAFVSGLLHTANHQMLKERFERTFGSRKRSAATGYRKLQQKSSDRNNTEEQDDEEAEFI